MRPTHAYLGLGLALVGVMMFACVARAHDWMPPHTKYCCNDKDCLPYPRAALERTQDGWVVKSTGQLFPDGSPDIHVNERPDIGEVWICVLPYEAPKARCIFILPEGS